LFFFSFLFEKILGYDTILYEYSLTGWLAFCAEDGMKEWVGSCVVGWLAGWLGCFDVDGVVGHSSDRYSVVTGGIVIAQVRLVV